MVYQLDRPVGYYRPPEKKGKIKRKRISPQRAEPEEDEIQVPPQQQEGNV